MPFKPNKKFKREYNKLFRKDPTGANILLLLCEIADEKGQVKLPGGTEEEVAEELHSLLIARFEDPEVYAL